MGNEIAKKYEVGERCIATAGQRGTWRVFPGTSKTTGEHVSVHVFDKDQLKALKKKDREAALQAHRADVDQLKILRHPRVLRVIETFEENKKMLAFVSEPVAGSLSNMFHDFSGFTGPDEVPEALREASVSAFEVSVGLMHLAEGLQFLHRDVRRLHLGLAPWSVFVTPTGAWKLAGLGMSEALAPGVTDVDCRYFVDFRAGKVASQAPQLALIPTTPSLRYASPEMTGGAGKVSPASDLFSLGLLAVEMMTSRNDDGTLSPIIEVPDENPATHAYRVQHLHPVPKLDRVPELLRPAIEALLNPGPASRPDSAQFMRCAYFDRGPIQTLRTLETLMEQPRPRQAQLLSQMPALLAPFPGAVIRDRVLPVLLEFARGEDIVGVVVPPLLVCVEKISQADFALKVATALQRIMSSPTITPATAVHLFESCNIMLKQADDHFLRDAYAPLIVKCFAQADNKVSEAAMRTIPLVAEKLDNRTIVSGILPPLMTLLTSPNLPQRVNALKSLNSLMKLLQKDFIVSTVLPALLSCIRAPPRNPAVSMCCVGCYSTAADLLGASKSVIHVAPFIVPLIADTQLNRKQVNIVAKTVHGILGKAVDTRHKELAQSEAMTRRQSEAEKSEIESRLREAKSADVSQFERPKLKQEEESTTFEPYRDTRTMEPQWGGFSGEAFASGGVGSDSPGASQGSGFGVGGFGSASPAPDNSRRASAAPSSHDASMFGSLSTASASTTRSHSISVAPSALPSGTFGSASAGTGEAARPPSTSGGVDMFAPRTSTPTAQSSSSTFAPGGSDMFSSMTAPTPSSGGSSGFATASAPEAAGQSMFAGMGSAGTTSASRPPSGSGGADMFAGMGSTATTRPASGSAAGGMFSGVAAVPSSGGSLGVATTPSVGGQSMFTGATSVSRPASGSGGADMFAGIGSTATTRPASGSVGGGMFSGAATPPAAPSPTPTSGAMFGGVAAPPATPAGTLSMTGTMGGTGGMSAGGLGASMGGGPSASAATGMATSIGMTGMGSMGMGGGMGMGGSTVGPGSGMGIAAGTGSGGFPSYAAPQPSGSGSAGVFSAMGATQPAPPATMGGGDVFAGLGSTPSAAPAGFGGTAPGGFGGTAGPQNGFAPTSGGQPDMFAGMGGTTAQQPAQQSNSGFSFLG